jgi:hypothetical protein
LEREEDFESGRRRKVAADAEVDSGSKPVAGC